MSLLSSILDFSQTKTSHSIIIFPFFIETYLYFYLLYIYILLSISFTQLRFYHSCLEALWLIKESEHHFYFLHRQHHSLISLHKLYQTYLCFQSPQMLSYARPCSKNKSSHRKTGNLVTFTFPSFRSELCWIIVILF